MSKSSSNIVASGILWRLFERIGAQGVSFIVTIILARLLDPSVYGTVALVMVFITVLQVFIDSGFGNALIQKKDADDLDFSTVFYFNVVVCLVLFVLMFFASPVIASFYNNVALVPVIRVLSITLIISGVKNVQQAYVSRHYLFKKFFFSTLGGTIVAAVVGIWMAYKGYGVWALVTQNLANQAIDTVILWITVKWRPKKMFSLSRLKELFNFGWKLLCSALIDTTYSKIRQLIIGKHYSSADLALYNKGEYFPYHLVTNINSALDSVLFPVMSKAQDDKYQVKAMTRRAIKTGTFIIAPLLFGLSAVATPMVRLLLTEKWLGCVFFLRIFCIIYLIQPLQTANLNAIKAMGRSDLFLKLEIMKKIVGLTAMFSTIFISVEVMTYSYLVTSVIGLLINAYPNKELLSYTIKEQILDIIPNLGLGLVMFICCYFVQYLGMSDLFTLIVQVLVGAVVYIGVAFLLKNESLFYTYKVSRELLSRHKREH